MDLNKFWLKYFGVVNLSDHRCTLLELSVLGKRLKFHPTPPKYCQGKLKESIDKFFQSAFLKAYFEPNGPEEPESILESSFLSEDDAEPEIFVRKDLKLPSTFNPQMPSNLEYLYNVLIDRILSDCSELNRRRKLAIKQFKALTDLKENKSILINKADKGSNVVIQNVDDYIKEGLRQMGDEKLHKKLDHYLTEEFRIKIHQVLEQIFADKGISEKTFLFLIKGGKKRSIFCMLPKIPKSKFLPRGRPIVSSVNSPTEKISMLLDIILQPFVLKTRTYIRDTGDFLSKVQGLELSPNDLMFSMDVMSFYTNIPHNNGIDYIKKILEQHVNSTSKNSSLVTLLEFVLKS